MAIVALKELLARGLIQNDSRLPPRTSRSLRARLRCRKPAAPGWKNHVRYKTPRVHLAARQRGGGVAARGEQAEKRCTVGVLSAGSENPALRTAFPMLCRSWDGSKAKTSFSGTAVADQIRVRDQPQL